MAGLYDSVRRYNHLDAAWRRVRDNGRLSKSKDTQKLIALFAENQHRNLNRIARQLAEHRFQFSPQTGIAKRRGKKKPRPLVVASIENRIVQRAILDTLQDDVPAVQQVLETPTSIGGIPGRGTRHAIALVTAAIKDGARYYIRSDIEDFFTKIPRQQAIDFIADHVRDRRFIDLFTRAIETQLENIEQLAEHRDLFPIGNDGVAQGSALSPLLGNIVLRDFDKKLNGRDILCVRYIDDFILLGKDEVQVKKEFESARKLLSVLGMRAYAPWENSDKAQDGPTSESIDFLGCTISGGLVQPSKDARAELLNRVDSVLAEGKHAIRDALAKPTGKLTSQRYIQTLTKLDRILLGWSHAFSFCTGTQVFASLDKDIDKRLTEFRRFATAKKRRVGPAAWRRIVGVHRLTDTPRLSIAEEEPDLKDP